MSLKNQQNQQNQQNDRIVITGLGALSPLGRDVASTWEGLLAGKSGVSRLPEDWSPDIPAQIAAKVASGSCPAPLNFFLYLGLLEKFLVFPRT